MIDLLIQEGYVEIYLAVTFLKRAEREDFYDRETNFNPLRWRE